MAEIKTPNWPADKVERRPLAALVPNARNARTHSAEQVAQLAASMREWGWTNPVLVDEGGGIIAGHGRVLAAVELGFAEAPVMVAEGWTEAQKRAYALADNQLALNAGWDMDTLADELRGLKDWDFDLSLLGFGNLDALLARGAGLTDLDETPPLPAVPVSKPGDCWLLGRHRLVCGDSTDADTVAQALAGVSPHLMVTDPPYGVEYDADWRNHALRSDGTTIAGRAVGKVMNSLEAAGFEIRCQLRSPLQMSCFTVSYRIPAWLMLPVVMTSVDYKAGFCPYQRSQTTLWNIDHLKSETGHSTQKPVECNEAADIENNSSPGQAVYEPFSGSGTTIIAAEMTGRACHAIELNPAYVDVAVLRWQAFTGETATLEADGRRFAA